MARTEKEAGMPQCGTRGRSGPLPISPAEQRRAAVPVLLTEQEMHQVGAPAQAAHLTCSTFVRQLVTAGLEHTAPAYMRR